MSSKTSPFPGETYALSCVSCRQRKVKCAKVYPCPHCVRGGLECIFPTRKKERTPRRNKNTELLSRLAKLEAIVGERKGQAAQGDGVDPTSESSAATAAAEAVTQSSLAMSSAGNPATAAGQQQQQQRVASGTDNDGWDTKLTTTVPAYPGARPAPTAREGSTANKYVSGEFWTNLAFEVEGIKTVLEQPSEGEEDSDSEGKGSAQGKQMPSRNKAGAAGRHQSFSHSPAAAAAAAGDMVSAAIFGNTQLAMAIPAPRHPPSEQIKKLREVYFANVDMLLKILHRPMMEREFDLFLVNPEDNAPSPAVEALFFAMYFAAITSLTPEKCLSELGEDRAVLALRYRQGVELALARADFLNNTELECLQALVLYNAILRMHVKSRASWALLALIHRLALAHNLHRDGAGTAFPPYEAEQRRRLWAQIIVLDVRAAQDRGTEPLIRGADDFTTQAPTNVDDADFGPGGAAVVAREGPTDVTFSRCTYACSRLYLDLNGAKAVGAAGVGDGGVVLAADVEEDLMARVKELETQFVVPSLAHPGHFGAAMGAAVVRLTSLIFWLTIQYPFRTRAPSTTKPRISRTHALQTAIAIMELQTFSPSGVSAAEWQARFAWWKDGYVQWHALAVALAELCVQTEGPLVERAWATVDKVLPEWRDNIADSRRGALWRPIRKLLRKARERRGEALARRPGGGGADAAAAGLGRTAAGPGDTSAPKDARMGTAAEEQAARRTTRAVLTPHQAATEVWPTGIPFNANFGDANTTTAATSTAAAPSSIMHNAHQWTIDFGNMDAMDLSGGLDFDMLVGDVPQQELDTGTLDWSVWNDFVNEANVSMEGASTTPSSEAQDAVANAWGTGASSGYTLTSSVITEREIPVPF